MPEVKIKGSISLYQTRNLRVLKKWRISMADEEGNLPSWDEVIDVLISRAKLEDVLT